MVILPRFFHHFGFFFCVAQSVVLVGRFRFLGFIRQSRRRFAYVELAGDHVGDQAGAVFVEEVYLILCP